MAAYEWDDLRYVLAVATAGSLAGAARALGVNHTTVLRRVAAFEERIGLRVFDRLPTGYVLTAGGEELVDAARRIDDTINTLTRKLVGRDLTLTGNLRVTSTDTLMESSLPTVLAEFKSAHPGIQIDLTISNTMNPYLSCCCPACSVMSGRGGTRFATSATSPRHRCQT